ncbi:PREDICTED: C-C motif chemokine 4 isoform X1 [Colobus angolensis palliatus]|uniref:C-C motif chemokine 4 isoform X1 n=2 Tax=Colobus angolensis palliatus TaxID=336983 RepID=UPI0005F51969|nr:PREDICTED: C-C motif chemokine 4 isoform X1 [Colobus angolensis palliatus]
MKLCVTVLSLLVLVAAFCSPALSAPMGSDPPTACCFSYTVRKLSRNFVVDYYETSSLCSQPAVVGWKFRESGSSAAQEGSHAPELPTWTMIRQRKMVTTGKG